MQLDQAKMKEMLRTANKAHSWHIECNTDLHSICALSILTEILKKETIKYEVGYESLENDVNVVLSIDNERYVLSGGCGLCECHSKEMGGICMVYGLAKSSGFINEYILWSVVVAYSFYKDLVLPDAEEEPRQSTCENAYNVAEWRKNGDGKDGRICSSCCNIQMDVIAQIKMMNCQNDGIFIKNTTALPFLYSSCLFTTLKSDLNFIFMRKLFNNRSKHGDRRICEILAGVGISIAFANEKYTSVSRSVQEIVDGTFGTKDAFVFRNGHDLEIQAVEHAFLVLFYLYRGHGLYGLLSLKKKRLVDVGKASRFYQNVIRLFKDGVTYHRNLKNVVVFQLKGVCVTAEEAKILFGILHSLFQRYVLYQYSVDIPRLIVGNVKSKDSQQDQRIILYSKGFKKSKIQIKDRISEDLIVIDSKDLSSVIVNMF